MAEQHNLGIENFWLSKTESAVAGEDRELMNEICQERKSHMAPQPWALKITPALSHSGKSLATCCLVRAMDLCNI